MTDSDEMTNDDSRTNDVPEGEDPDEKEMAFKTIAELIAGTQSVMVARETDKIEREYHDRQEKRADRLQLEDDRKYALQCAVQTTNDNLSSFDANDIVAKARAYAEFIKRG